jgi:hypothetical protein
MSMKTAILNSAVPYLTRELGPGFKLSITHFSLAWVSSEEREANPVTASMTEMVRQTPVDGIVRGDYIYNVWQSPFAYDRYAGQFPAPSKVSEELERGFGNNYQYEYDDCAGRNVLQPNQITTYDELPPEAKTFFDGSGEANHSFYGYVEGSGVTGKLTVENTPPPLQYSSTDPSTIPGVGEYTKFFPIKAFRPITQKNVENATIMNYSLNLPPISVNYGNSVDFYGKSIGNFKFNRVGLYMTVCAERDDAQSTPDPKDFYEPMATMESIFTEDEQYPILFAVIDIGVPSAGCSGNDISFDIYKTRDDKGFAGWEFDAQLTISTKVLEATDEFYTLYADAIRDDATKYYQAQMMNNASMAQTIMQLQMMVLQLATRVEEITGVNPFTPYKIAGYDVNGGLELDKEYILSKGSANRKMLLDAVAFRGVTSGGIQYINSSNALFSLKTFNSNNKVADGDFIKITLYNLDGRYYSESGNDVSWWNGSILFANYDEENETKTKIFEINSDLIKGKSFAKVTLLFSYSGDSGWVLESQSVIDESSFIS